MTSEERKAKKAAYNKEYREKNKDYQKEYYEKNKEKILKQQKEYREKNKEKYKEYDKKRYESYYMSENFKKAREKYLQKDSVKEYYLKHKKELNNATRENANNHGSEWTYEDVCQLINLLEQGKTAREIASIMGRTMHSINARKRRIRKDGFNYNPDQKNI